MRATRSSLWVSGLGGPAVRQGGSRAGLQLWAAPLTSRPVPAVFIYSMPGYKCSIKERMLYSSCKSRLLDSVEQDFQLEIAKKVGAHPPVPVTPPSSWGVGAPRQWQSRGHRCLSDGWGNRPKG